MTVTDDPPEEKQFSAAELLEMVLAAYERGLTDAAAQRNRDFWRSPEAERLRLARQVTEARDMKARAVAQYASHGHPEGYDYRGGPVDWWTGMPSGTACAWLRRQRTYELAGGEQ